MLGSVRIVSLLPSATEIVCALGLTDQLVGVTHECDFPEAVAGLPAVTRSVIEHANASSREIHDAVTASVHGGSSIYALDRDMLRELRPDLILTQELCEVCAVAYGEVRDAVRVLDSEATVVSLEPTTLAGVLASIVRVGDLLDVRARAKRVVSALRVRIGAMRAATARFPSRPSVLALEWIDPPFFGGHWVPDMIEAAGGRDVYGVAGRHSMLTTWQSVADAAPEVVVVMPCGFDRVQTEAELARTELPETWWALPAVRAGRVYAVDGSAFFSRPGPRLVDGVEILYEILHPDRVERRHGESAWRPWRPG